MKIKQIILLAILVFGQTLCFAQTEQQKKELGSTELKQDTPFFVLKVADKSLEFDARKNENFDAKMIDPDSIESIEVLKGDDATAKYGDKGQNGIVIITFKDFNLLSKELQTKFTDSIKK